MSDHALLSVWLNIGLLLLLLATGHAIVRARSMLASVVLFSIFSLEMAMLYLILAAPDVAITEAAVGAGVSTVIFLAALMHTGHDDWGQAATRRIPALSATSTLPALIAVGITGAMLLYAMMDLPAYGLAEASANSHVGHAYIQAIPEEIGIPNAVTAILASYRGFDTLGETCVIFAALLGVALIFGQMGRNDA